MIPGCAARPGANGCDPFGVGEATSLTPALPAGDGSLDPALPRRRLTLANVPAEDPAVYEMIGRADTVGVFQIESRAQMSMLPRLKPTCFYDLVIEVAIVRPGPIQGGMVHPYLRRRRGEEEVTYPNEAVKAVLHKTLGVPLFQEQAMRLAVVAAGFTPGEADQLRRAMGAWRKRGVMDKFRAKLLAGMRANGLPDEFADRVYRQLQGFGEYGFPESHAASFARLVYVSAWLKRYHPAEFAAALINSQPMGFYQPAQIVRDAREHGVEVLPPDVNESDWDCTLESRERRAKSKELREVREERGAIRLGLRLVRGLPEEQVKRLTEARASRRFRSLNDLVRRTELAGESLLRLAAADGFRSLGLDRRAGLWQAMHFRLRDDLPLFADLDLDEPVPELPAEPMLRQVSDDYHTLGLSLKAHPMGLIRDELDKLGLRTAEQVSQLANGQPVKTAGLVLVRQRPGTARGITFFTLEDETGIVNLIVRPEVFSAHRRAARTAAALIAEGSIQRDGIVVHVLVTKLQDLAEPLLKATDRSRNFR